MDQLSPLAHEIWAAAQLMPDEGIEDGVERIIAILKKLEALHATRVNDTVIKREMVE